MSGWLIAIAVVVWTLFVFWAGMKYGGKLKQDALNALQADRNALAAKIKGQV